MFKKPSDFYRKHLKNRFHDVEQRLDSMDSTDGQLGSNVCICKLHTILFVLPRFLWQVPQP